MLKLQFKDQRQPAFWVVEKLFSIGRDRDNHLVLDEPDIAPVQARLITTADKTFLKDNHSDSGCFVNGQRITQREILPGDELRFGSVELEVLPPEGEGDTDAEPWRLVASGSWLAGQSFAVPPSGTVVAGRSEHCDIVIPGSHLSRRHAELWIENHQLRIRDLGSVNGTFLNDRPVTESPARSGDELRLDVYTFKVVAPETDPGQNRRRASSSVNRPPQPTPVDKERPRRWKTRPTSPGNRQEPTYEEPRADLWPWALVIVVAALMVAVFLWV